MAHFKPFKSVTTLALGLRPKQKHEKVQVKSAIRESHLHSQICEGMCQGMNPHTPKWTPILGVGVPMDSRFFRE